MLPTRCSTHRFLRVFVVVLCGLAGPALASAQVQLAGEWTGSLNAGSVPVRLAWHVKAAPDGSMTSTFDNVDEQAFGIKTKTIKLDGQKLVVTVDDTVQVNGQGIKVQGALEGTLSADGNEVNGTWTQSDPPQSPMELSMKRQPASVAASPIDGVWSGALDVGDLKLRLLIKVLTTSEGLTAQLQSPDQSPMWVPVKIVRDGSDVTVSQSQFGIEYKARLAADMRSMDGTLTQGGVPRPLALKYSTDAPVVEHRRPQNPVKPYPYREEEVTYANPAGDKMSATLTIPQGQGPFPAVVLIQGSGRHERDEEVLQHRPFLVLSDYLTRHGILVLRADKRGVGKSGGNYDTATTADFADDAEAGFRFLKARPEVDVHRVGLIGHSEGGVIAPIVAARNRDVAFVVLLAGTGVNGAEIVTEQQKLVALAAGQPREKVEADFTRQRQVFQIIVGEKNNAEAEKKLRAAMAGQESEQQITGQVNTFLTPWFRYFLTYEPATSLRQVQCPALVLNGSLDLQVPPAQNLPPIREALRGNRHAEIDELPGLNHLFQTAKTGSPAEYVDIEETMSPAVLEKISAWIQAQSPRAAKRLEASR